ncbi:hypothetical protein KEM48_003079 [Puccinia striiformis f. sp. tritici PST-130]|nr:hypothetical protein KEM48_003079 [Puccinia striiformis f. sp. tritici PST-130]
MPAVLGGRHHWVATASTEVWERYLGFHPYARKFWGSPFPEFHKLDLILAISGPPGKMLAQSLSKATAQCGSQYPW